MVSDSGFVLQSFEGTINLAPMGVLKMEAINVQVKSFTIIYICLNCFLNGMSSFRRCFKF